MSLEVTLRTVALGRINVNYGAIGQSPVWLTPDTVVPVYFELCYPWCEVKIILKEGMLSYLNIPMIRVLII